MFQEVLQHVLEKKLGIPPRNVTDAQFTETRDYPIPPNNDRLITPVLTHQRPLMTFRHG